MWHAVESQFVAGLHPPGNKQCWIEPSYKMALYSTLEKYDLYEFDTASSESFV